MRLVYIIGSLQVLHGRIIWLQNINLNFCFKGGDLTEKIHSWKKSGKMFDESLIIAWLVQLLLAIQFIHKK